jgi:hypothetical protein
MIFKLLLLLVAFTSSAFARLGETLEQCQARYGAPVQIQMPTVLFRKGKWSVGVTFFQGIVHLISYGKIPDQDDRFAFTQDEVDAFMKSNAGDRAWVSQPAPISKGQHWATKDGEVYSILHDGMLIFRTRAAVERSIAADKAKADQSVKGF